MQLGAVSTEVLTTVFSVGISTAFTLGVLKSGQTANEKSLKEHAEAQKADLAGLRETVDKMAAEIHGAVTSTARHDERLGALERATEERISALRASLERSTRDETLAREELKGDFKRHGRELESLKVWRAGVNQRLVAIDPNWRAD